MSPNLSKTVFKASRLALRSVILNGRTKISSSLRERFTSKHFFLTSSNFDLVVDVNMILHFNSANSYARVSPIPVDEPTIQTVLLANLFYLDNIYHRLLTKC